MPVSVSKSLSDGLEIEVYEGNRILVGFVPRDFFEDQPSPVVESEWLNWVADNAVDVERAVIVKTDGGFLNARWSQIQSRGVK